MISPENKVEVSIVIPSWNAKRELKDCLTALGEQSYSSFEVIVVDNASTDSSVRMVRRTFSDVKIIENRENRGYSPATNQGIEVSSGKYIVMLNNDAIPEPDWLERLVEVAEEHKDVGMCGSKMVSMHNPEIIDSTGIEIYRDGSGSDRGMGEMDEGQFHKVEEIFGPCGGAALYKREMLSQIGLLDERYFAYYEDIDLAWRAKLAGWRCLYSPRAVIKHERSRTGGQFSLFKIYQTERNRIWTALKNFPVKYALEAPFRNSLKLSRIAFLQDPASRRKIEYVKRIPLPLLLFTLIRARRDAYRELPSVMAKRAQIQTKVKVSVKEIDMWFERFGPSLSEKVCR